MDSPPNNIGDITPASFANLKRPSFDNIDLGKYYFLTETQNNIPTHYFVQITRKTPTEIRYWIISTYTNGQWIHIQFNADIRAADPTLIGSRYIFYGETQGGRRKTRKGKKSKRKTHKRK